MKNIKYSIFICLFTLAALQSKGFTLIELLLYSHSSNQIVFIPDSLYNDLQNVTVNLEIYEGNDFNDITSIYSETVSLNDTALFEYLGSINFDPENSNSGIQHSYKIRKENLNLIGNSAFFMFYSSIYFNEIWVKEFFSFIRNCSEQLTICPNKRSILIQTGANLRNILGVDNYMNYGYNNDFSLLESNQKNILTNFINIMLQTNHTIAEFEELFSGSIFESNLPLNFCDAENAKFDCSIQNEFSALLTEIVNVYKTMPAPLQDYTYFWELHEEIQRIFWTLCSTLGNYWPQIYTNNQNNGYEIRLIPFTANRPIVHAAIIFEGDSIYSKVAYSYTAESMEGVRYDSLGQFTVLENYALLDTADECPLRPWLCDESAALITQSPDTLQDGSTATFTSQPDNQRNYYFLGRDSLSQIVMLQEGNSNVYQLEENTQIDSIFVWVENNDGCFSNAARLVKRAQNITCTFNISNIPFNSNENSLFPCVSNIIAFVNYQNLSAGEVIRFSFPNSIILNNPFSEISQGVAFNYIDYTVPEDGDASFELSMRLTNCSQPDGNSNPVNLSEIRFSCYLYDPDSQIQLYTNYSGPNGSPIEDTPDGVTFNFNPNPINIVPGLNQNFTGNDGATYIRGFRIEIVSPALTSFNLSLTPEIGALSNGLTLIGNGNTPQLYNLPVSQNFSLIGEPYEQYIQTDISTGIQFLEFQQDIILECVNIDNEGSSIAQIQTTVVCEGCSTNLIQTATMDGYVNTTSPPFAVTNSLTTSGQIGCEGTYTNSLTFTRNGNNEVLMEQIRIPINTNYFTPQSLILNGTSIPFVTIPTNVTTNETGGILIDLIDIASTSQNIPNFNLANQGYFFSGISFNIEISLIFNCTLLQVCSSEDYALNSNNRIVIDFKDACANQRVDNIVIVPITNNNETNPSITGGSLEIDFDFAQGPYKTLSYQYIHNDFEPLDLSGTAPACGSQGVQYRAVFSIDYVDDEDDVDGNLIDFSLSNVILNNSQTSNSLIINPRSSSFPVTINSEGDLTDIDFTIDFQSCPFDLSPYSGGLELHLEIQAYCEDCEECYRTINCTNDILVVHCSGDCDGANMIGTDEVTLERTTFGYENEIQFLNGNYIDDIADFNVAFPGLTELQIKEELQKVYPFDIIEIKAEGTTNPGFLLEASLDNVFQNIGFEVAYTPIQNVNLEFVNGFIHFHSPTNVSPSQTVLQSFSIPVLVSTNPQQEAIPVFGYPSIINFERLILQPLGSNPLLDNLDFAEYEIEFTGRFRISPTLDENGAIVIAPGAYEQDIRCQFFADGTDLGHQVSCDPWGAYLLNLIPGYSVEVSNINPANDLQLTLDYQPNEDPVHNVITYDFSDEYKNYCYSKFGVGVHLTGGFGENVKDFNYEFRPMIKWPNNVDVDSRLTEAYPLYQATDNIIFNQPSTGTGQLSNSNNAFPLLSSLEKTPNQYLNRYQGLALAFDKNCPNAIDRYPIDISFEHHAYLHVGHGVLPENFNKVQEIGTVNNVGNFANDVLNDNLQFDFNEILVTSFPVSSYNFDLNITLNPPPATLNNVFLYYTLEGSNGSVMNVPFIISSASGPNFNNFIGGQESNSYVFEGGITESISGTIPIRLNCNNETFKLKIYMGAFCSAAELQQCSDDPLDFIANTSSSIRCRLFVKEINFNPSGVLPNEANVTQKTLSLINEGDDCYVKWDVKIKSQPNNTEIRNPTLYVAVPQGLILTQALIYINAGIANVPITAFDFQPISEGGQNVPVFKFTLPSNLNYIFATEDELHYEFRFQFSEGLCDDPLNIPGFKARFLGNEYCPIPDATTPLTSFFTFDKFFTELEGGAISSIGAVGNEHCCIALPVTITAKGPCSMDEEGVITLTNTTINPDNPNNPYTAIFISSAGVSDPIQVQGDLTNYLYPVTLTQQEETYTVVIQMATIVYLQSVVISNSEVVATINANTTSFCPNDPFTLNLEAIDSNPLNVLDNYTYQWFGLPPSTQVIGDANILTGNFTEFGTYQVEITNITDNCIGTAQINITPIEVATLDIIFPNELCPGQFGTVNFSHPNGELRIDGVDVTLPYVFNTNNLTLGQHTLTYRWLNTNNCYSEITEIVNIASGNCGCECTNLDLTEIVVPQNITNSQQFILQYGSFNSTVINKCFLFQNNLQVISNIEFVNCNLRFSEGYGINISNGVNFNANSNTKFSGCSKMWKGIDNEGRLYLTNCIVKDAQYGVSMLSGNAFDLGGTIFSPSPNSKYTKLDHVTFLKNFVSVRNRRIPFIPERSRFMFVNNHAYDIQYCNFNGGSLLPNYVGQTPYAHPNGGIAGVYVDRFSLYLNKTNSFNNLFCGILSNSSRVRIEGAVFNEIKAIYGNYMYTTSTYNFGITNQTGVQSAGIYIKNNSWGSISLIDLDPNFPQFTSCYTGIWADRSRLEVNNLVFGTTSQPVWVGIKCTRAISSNRILINNNIFRSKEKGIDISNSIIKNSSITENNITVYGADNSTTPFLLNSSAGISLIGVASAYDIITVERNTINILNTNSNSFYDYGINAQDVFEIYFKENKIRRRYTSRGEGLTITESSKCEVNCNYSLGWDIENVDNTTLKTENNFGIVAKFNNSLRINSNKTNHTKFGISLQGDNTGALISANEFIDHNTGLILGNPNSEILPTFIANQTDMRNIWNTSTPSAFGARRTSGASSLVFQPPADPPSSPLPPAIATNRFYVKGSVMPFYPSHTPSNSDNCFQDLFFTCETGISELYENDCNYSGSTNAGYRIGQLYDVTNNLIANEVNADYYGNEMHYSMQKNMDNILNTSELMIPDTGAFSVLKQQLLSTNLHKYNMVKDLFDSRTLDSTEYLLQNQLWASLDSLTFLFDSLQAVFIADSASQILNNTNYLAILNNLSQQINDIERDLSSSEQDEFVAQCAKNDTAAFENSKLTPANNWEVVEKKVNTLYTISMDSTFVEFTTAQKQEIDSIAYLCPYLSHTAVYKARSLQYMYNDSSFYDDAYLCAISSMRLSNNLATDTSINEYISIFPNPTKNDFQVYINSEIKSNYKIEITTVLGQVVYKQANLRNQFNINFAELGISNGVYMINILQTETGKLFHKKIIYDK